MKQQKYRTKIFLDNEDISWTDPDSSEALEFLVLAEAAGITHHEVLNVMAGRNKE